MSDDSEDEEADVLFKNSKVQEPIPKYFFGQNFAFSAFNTLPIGGVFAFLYAIAPSVGNFLKIGAQNFRGFLTPGLLAVFTFVLLATNVAHRLYNSVFLYAYYQMFVQKQQKNISQNALLPKNFKAYQNTHSLTLTPTQVHSSKLLPTFGILLTCYYINLTFINDIDSLFSSIFNTHIKNSEEGLVIFPILLTFAILWPLLHQLQPFERLNNWVNKKYYDDKESLKIPIETQTQRAAKFFQFFVITVILIMGNQYREWFSNSVNASPDDFSSIHLTFAMTFIYSLMNLLNTEYHAYQGLQWIGGKASAGLNRLWAKVRCCGGEDRESRRSSFGSEDHLSLGLINPDKQSEDSEYTGLTSGQDSLASKLRHCIPCLN